MINFDFNNCLQELKNENAKFFETKLAETFIDFCGDLASIKKVSSAIITVLTNNAEQMLFILEDNTIQDELYNEKIYRHLNIDSIRLITPIQIYNQLIEALNNPAYKTTQIINIHVIFIHRIFNKLASQEQVTQKAELVSRLFPADLFSKENRGRIEIKSDFDLIKSAGANRNRFFKNKLKETQVHSPAFLRFAPDEQSSFFRMTTNLGMPIVAGVSGHMGSFLLGALLYGELTTEELREYCFTCALTLIHGGNHSLHEAMIVAQRVNIPYATGNYLSTIPDTIKQRAEFLELCAEFSNLVEHSISPFSQ